jgi:hypothetical protein
MNKNQATAQISEDIAKIKLLKLGYEIFDPHFHTTPIDILAYKNGKFLKIQVKTLFKRKKDSIKREYKTPQYQSMFVRVQPQKGYDGHFVKKRYDNFEIDGFILVHEEDDICLYIPVSLITGLTFKRTKNGCSEYSIEKMLTD